MLLDFRIFLDAPLNSLARVDLHLGTKIMSVAFIDSILTLIRKRGTCLCDWMMGIKIFIDATLNSSVQVVNVKF